MSGLGQEAVGAGKGAQPTTPPRVLPSPAVPLVTCSPDTLPGLEGACGARRALSGVRQAWRATVFY